MPHSACIRAFHAAWVSAQGSEGGGRGGGELVKAKASEGKEAGVRVRERAMAASVTVVSEQGRVGEVDEEHGGSGDGGSGAAGSGGGGSGGRGSGGSGSGMGGGDGGHTAGWCAAANTDMGGGGPFSA